MSMFRQLTPGEEIQFRRWARDNFNPAVKPSPLWHPVVRDEWSVIAKERSDSQPGDCPRCNSFDDDLSARGGICESCYLEEIK